MNGCAPGLALIKRFKATRKWAIGDLHDGVIRLELPESFTFVLLMLIRVIVIYPIGVSSFK